MRIVSGSVGGRTLVSPTTEGVRPTKDRVREALFNSLSSHGWVVDRSFIDLFAGSGALGLEALSRGASSCLFVDRDKAAIAAVRQNVEDLALGDRSEVNQVDGLVVARSEKQFDVALLDPPYEFELWEELLDCLSVEVIVIESDRTIDPGPGWEILKEKRYAGTVVVIARRLSDEFARSTANNTANTAQRDGSVPPGAQEDHTS
ncbi:MAG: 16S rRNA (guanine(966)-N(2))-methyltransferase RsmD [Acidimicrobiales bacterium]